MVEFPAKRLFTARISTYKYDLSSTDDSLVQTPAYLEQGFPEVRLKRVDANFSVNLPFHTGGKGPFNLGSTDHQPHRLPQDCPLC